MYPLRSKTATVLTSQIQDHPEQPVCRLAQEKSKGLLECYSHLVHPLTQLRQSKEYKCAPSARLWLPLACKLTFPQTQCCYKEYSDYRCIFVAYPRLFFS